MEKSIWKLKRLWLLLCAPVAGGLLAAAQCLPTSAQWYAVTLYPPVSRAGNWLSGLVPFSLMEVFLGAALLLVPSYIIYAIIKLCRHREQRKRNAVRLAANPLCLAALLFLLFTLNCGINYHRLTFAETCGLTLRPSSVQELTALCESLAESANSLRAQVPEDADGVALLSGGFAGAAEEARAAFGRLSEDYPFLTGGYGAPKPVLFSRVMSYCDTTGIFWPFTMEANVNTDAPAYTQPATMCHELSHLRGFMREDEANFIGVLACEKSENPAFGYSGAILSYVYAGNALYSVSPKAATRIGATLSPAVQRDLSFSAAYWQRFATPVRELATAANNSYLKANSQEDGVASYGRMVDLLLAKQRQA